MKESITLFAVLGLVLALAPAVNAGVIPVANGDFELPALSANTETTTIPISWTADAQVGGGNAIMHEGRDGKSYPSPSTNQAMYFDKRPTEGESLIHQDLGSITTLGLGSETSLDFSFDVRFGAADGEAITEQATTVFRAYWIVNGVIQAGGQYSSDLGTGTRDLRTWVEINADTGGNFDNKTVSLDPSGVDVNDTLAVGFGYAYLATGDNYHTRTYVDNVTASVVSGGTPGTLIFGQ
jgi:hypothetical protein